MGKKKLTKIAIQKNKLKEKLKKFIQNNTELKSVSWTQFTPYYDDGDICDFRISFFGYTPSMTLNEEQLFRFWSSDIGAIDICYNVTDLGIISTTTYDNLVTLKRDLIKSLKLLEKMFGDHAIVTLERDGICVDQYQHQ